MAYNKIVINGEVKIDLTRDTAIPEDVVEGKTFHSSSGTQLKGTRKTKQLQSKRVVPNATTQTIKPDDGYELSEVTVVGISPEPFYKPEKAITVTPKNEPQTIIPEEGYVFNSVTVNTADASSDINIRPENIVEGVTILGVTGSKKIKLPKFLNKTLEELDEEDLEGVTTISTGEFSNFPKLSKIHIPPTLDTIDAQAFYNCSALTNVIFEEGLKHIKDSAFSTCSNLVSIDLPDTLETIGNDVFSSCTKLENILLSKNLQRIAGRLCQKLPKLKYNYHGDIDYLATKDNPYFATFRVIPTISNKAQSLHPDTKIIGGYTFYYYTSTSSSSDYCKILLDSILLPEGLITIDSYAFYNQSNLLSVTLPSTLLHIGPNAFYNCNKLTEIIIPDNVETLSNGAFQNCSELTSITIGKNVTTIPESLFYNCKKVSTFNYNARNAVRSNSSNNSPFYYMGSNTTGITVNIGEDVELLPNHLFNDGSSTTYKPKITEVHFSGNSKCKEIGQYCFAALPYLTSINIPSSVETVETYAFMNCSSLKTITFNEGLKTIKPFAFSGAGVEALDFPDSLMDPGSISNLSGLKTVSFGPNIIKDNGYLINDCPYLETINYNIQTLDEDETNSNAQFYSCGKSSAQGITFNVGPDVVRLPPYLFMSSHSNSPKSKISNITFSENSKLIEIAKNACASVLNQGLNINLNLPEGLQTIQTYAFYGCSDIKSLILPSTLSYIGSRAFYNCTGITNLNIPDSVQTIEDTAFHGCSNITTLTLGEGLTNVRYDAFKNLSKLTEININSENLTSSTAFLGAGTSATHTILNVGSKVKRLSEGIFSSTTPSSTSFNGTNSCQINEISFAEESVLTTIETYAFKACKINKPITFPESLTTIETYAFSDCQHLPEITLNKNITSIEGYAFYNCYQLTKVTCLADTPPQLGYNVFPSNVSEIWVKAGKKDAYIRGTNWTSYANKIYELPEEV